MTLGKPPKTIPLMLEIQDIINNSYSIMEVFYSWEMGSAMPFQEFKTKLLSDPDFDVDNELKIEIEKEDYNPWRKIIIFDKHFKN